MHITMGLFEVNDTILEIIHDYITISFVGKIWYVTLNLYKMKAQIFLLWQQLCIPSLIVNP
jgi:hypothetical protein